MNNDTVIDVQDVSRAPLALVGGRQVSAPERMLELAISKGVNMDQLQQLMELKERFDEKEAEKAFTEAMTRFKENAPEIIKTKLVEHSGISYKHATLADVCAAAIKGLAEVGVSHKWVPKQDPGMVGVSCTLTHRLGHSESVYLEAPADTSGKKNAIQSIASTVTYLQRYTLLAITGLATQDQDDDGAQHKDPLPDWVDIYLKAITTAPTKEDLAAAWKTAVRACIDAHDTVAHEEMRDAMIARGEALGLEKKA